MQVGNLVLGLHILKTGELSLCEPCIEGKQHRLPFPKEAKQAEELLEIVHSDICGPMSQDSFSGTKYFITFTDDKCRQSTIYFLKSKGEVFSRFQEYKAYAEKQTGKYLKILRIDNRGKYCSTVFKEYCKKARIRMQGTAPYIPE